MTSRFTLYFQALEMIKDIRVAVNEILEEVDWMDNGTKVVAKEKVTTYKRGELSPESKANFTGIGKKSECNIGPLK